MNKQVAIITGVTSFLGKSTAKYLLSKGFIVYGITRPGSKKKDALKDISGLITIDIDFENIVSQDFDQFKNHISEKEYDILSRASITFIHFGWGATLDRTNFMMQMLNVDYSMKVLEFAKILKAKKFIFAGSQAEYSDTAYGLAKKQFAHNAVKYLKDTDMKFIHYRIFSIYGKDDRDTSLIKTLVKSLREGKDIDLSSCEFKWNFLHIDDFTYITYKFITKNIATGTYDIASDDTRLLKDYCIEAKDVLGARAQLNFGAREDKNEKFAIPHIEKMIEAIGKIKFTKFRDGILSI